MTINQRLIRLLHCSLFAGLATSNAAIIVGYDFDDGTGSHGVTHDPENDVYDAGTLVGTLDPTVTAANVTASSFGTGAGLNDVINISNGNSNYSNLDAEGNVFGTANGVEFGGARNDFGFTDMNNNNNLAGAINNGDYMTFEVGVNSGYELDLTSFTFRTRVNSLNQSAERWALFSSVAGFEVGNEILTGQTTNVGTWDGATNSVVIDLSAPEFQNLTEDTEFRLYIYGGNQPSSSATLFDKVILNGEVQVVPEPSVALLAGLGSLALFRRRRV